MPEIVFADFLGRHREQPLLLERASDEIRDVVLGVAQGRHAGGRLNISHQAEKDLRQGIRSGIADRAAPAATPRGTHNATPRSATIPGQQPFSRR